MKKIFKPALIGTLVISSMTTPVFASSSIDVDTTSSNYSSTYIEMIEDNGDSYIEIVIPAPSPQLLDFSILSSGTYESTYDMTGGVYTKSSWVCENAPTFKVTIDATSYAGNNDADMTINLEKKSGLTWSSVDSDTVPLKSGGRVTLSGNSSGTYRIYLRNNGGRQATGNIYISYSC